MCFPILSLSVPFFNLYLNLRLSLSVCVFLSQLTHHIRAAKPAVVAWLVSELSGKWLACRYEAFGTAERFRGSPGWLPGDRTNWTGTNLVARTVNLF